MQGASNPTHVNAIEQHCQLRRVHLDRSTIVGYARRTKAAFFQTFVIEDEATAIPKQDLATVTSTPQKHEQMPGEQIHAPLPTDNSAQAVVATTKIDWLDREVDPNTWRQCEQRLPQPANHGCHVRGIAAFLETKPKPGTELKLDLFRSGASQPYRQQRERLALHRRRAGRLVQVVLQGGVRDSVFGCNRDAGNGALSRLRHNRCPEFSSTRW